VEHARRFCHWWWCPAPPPPHHLPHFPLTRFTLCCHCHCLLHPLLWLVVVCWVDRVGHCGHHIAAWIIIVVIIVSPPSPAEERTTVMCKGGRGHGGNCFGVNTAPLPCCGRAGKASKRMFSWSSLLTTSLKTVFFLELYCLVWAEPNTIATSAILYLIKFLSYHFTVKPPCFYGTNRKLLKRAF
jgi:hypothetical protein